MGFWADLGYLAAIGTKLDGNRKGTLLDPFALYAPFHYPRPAVFGLVEKDLLCAIMTITVGVDLGFPWGFSF